MGMGQNYNVCVWSKSDGVKYASCQDKSNGGSSEIGVSGAANGTCLV